MKSICSPAVHISNYPKLIISSQTAIILLASSEKDGIVVGNPDNCNPLGSHITPTSGYWFDYDGVITLRNN